MTRGEIILVVEELYFGSTSIDAVTGLLDKLEVALPNADISDLIFYDFRGLTPEQVVDQALQRQADFTRQVGRA